MACSGTMRSCFLIFTSFFIFWLDSGEAQMVPAIYVFGDSLVDVGNNNYLSLSIVKANHPHYGIDFPTKKATGRFCNGKNAADFVAEKLGLPTSPPYLSLLSKANKNNATFLDGVSFASAGAGIFDGTDERLKQSIPLTKQVDYYVQVNEEMTKEVGADALKTRLAKSIFVFVIGSNDLLYYLGSANKKSTPAQYVNSMAYELKAQLKRLYDCGARKFEIAGVGPIGCCPIYRVKNKTHECYSEANYLAVQYNQVLENMLEEWKPENNGISYSYFDTYSALNDLIQNPTAYGFTEVKSACCGTGELRAKGPCLPISSYCPRREDYIFWDQYHPTEAAARIIVDTLYGGPSKYTFPINMKQLVAL